MNQKHDELKEDTNIQKEKLFGVQKTLEIFSSKNKINEEDMVGMAKEQQADLMEIRNDHDTQVIEWEKIKVFYEAHLDEMKSKFLEIMKER